MGGGKALRRAMLALPVLAVLCGAALAGDNTVKLCRAGTSHGVVCSVDGDCSGGICTKLGHPRRCSWQRHCAVSGTPCSDNADCPLFPYGICTSGCNAADYCAFPNFGNLVDCTSDANCGTCLAGLAKGLYCDADNDCPSSTCTAASGTCINGIEQGQIQIGQAVLSGLSGDLIADDGIGMRTLEDAPAGTGWGGTDYFQPTGINYDPTTGDVYVYDVTRVMRLPAVAGANTAADLVLGQATLPGGMLDDRLPGDITQGAMGSAGAGSFGWTFWGGVDVHRSTVGSAEGIWVATRYAVMRFALAAVTGDAATDILGFTTPAKTTVSTYRISDQPRGPAMLDRCVGGASIGLPCTVDGDCAASTCKTTLCITDEEYNRTPCWRDVGNAADGANPDFVLGQNDTANTSNGCNTGGRDATTQCGPNGVAFDAATGEIWVADTDNYRALRYPADAVSNEAADRVLGQANFTSATFQAPSATSLNAPLGIAVSLTGSHVAIADSFNNRIKVHLDGAAADNEAADSVVCQPNFTSTGNAKSSDGTLCDRCTRPNGLSWDSADGLWVADGGGDASNRRVFRFTTPDITGSGASATTARLQGQPTCAEGTLPVNSARFSAENTGAMGGMAESATGRFLVTDPGSNRALWWNSSTLAKTGETVANGVLGQANLTDKRVNRGSTASVNTMSGPRGAAYSGVGAAQDGLYIADTNNNRVLKWLGQNWTTGQNANGVYGHSGDTSNATCNQHGWATELNGARNLCGPEGVDTDAFGNLWVADSTNGRVLLFCNAANTIEAPASTFICVSGNSGDDVADLVLGKNTMNDTSVNCTTGVDATTLCRPVKVETAGNTQGTFRVIVSDVGPGDTSGRVVLYQQGIWVSGGIGAVILGSRPNLNMQYTSYGYASRGTCELDGVSQQIECNYTEPEGATAGTGGKTCTGGSSVFAGCTTDANCPDGANIYNAPTTGKCGCPSSGYCLWRRTIGEPYGLVYDETNDILYVGASGGINQYIGPIFNNSPARARGLKGFPHRFYAGFGDGSFVENSFGGMSAAIASDLELDSLGNLYSGVGPLYGWGIYAFDNPLPATSTPTTTRTRTRTFTPTITDTPTPTPTITNTISGSTPTSTPTFTPTSTSTFTLTRTVTFTATATATGSTPTHTVTPIPATPTVQLVTSRRVVVSADSAFPVTGSSCTKVAVDWTNYGSQVIRCPMTGNPTFFVRFYVPPSMPRNPQFVMKGRSSLDNASDSCWQVSNVVLRAATLEEDAFDANAAELGAGINYTMTHLPPGNSPTSSDTAQQFVLYNSGKGGVCNTDSECDDMVGYVKVTRVTCGIGINVDLEAFVWEF